MNATPHADPLSLYNLPVVVVVVVSVVEAVAS
jgi:hypothetical protein